MRHGRIRLHRTLSHGGRNARHRRRRSRFAVARRQARAVHHPGRHAHDADGAVFRPLPGSAGRQGGGGRLSRGARHAPTDGRRGALAPRRRARRRRPRRQFASHEPRMDGPRDVRDDRRDLGRRDHEPLGRRLRQDGDGVAQPADLRLRPHRDLRAGVPARGRRLLRRQQVFLPRHRRRRRHQLHALAGRADHQLRDHRQRLHARARGHRSRRGDGHGADRRASRSSSPRTVSPASISARRGKHGSARRRCPPGATSSGSTSRCGGYCP